MISQSLALPITMATNGLLIFLCLLVVTDDALDFILRAEDYRHALVQTGRLDIHDALVAGGGHAARLFDDEGHRIGLIHQAQLAEDRKSTRLNSSHSQNLVFRPLLL